VCQSSARNVKVQGHGLGSRCTALGGRPHNMSALGGHSFFSYLCCFRDTHGLDSKYERFFFAKTSVFDSIQCQPGLFDNIILWFATSNFKSFVICQSI